MLKLLLKSLKNSKLPNGYTDKFQPLSYEFVFMTQSHRLMNTKLIKMILCYILSCLNKTPNINY